MKGAIIFDFYCTLYDPDTKQLLQGAKEVLDKYSEHYALALLSTGDANRRQFIEELGISHYFKQIVITEHKQPKVLEHILQLLKVSKQDAWVVGDRIRKEIRCANQAGIKSVWLRSGKFAIEGPTGKGDIPTHTITSLLQLPMIIAP